MFLEQNNGGAIVEIYNVEMRLIKTDVLEEGRVDLSGLKLGIYFIKMKDGLKFYKAVKY